MEIAKVIGNKKLTHDVFELTLKPPKSFSYKAGQYITIKINDKKTPCFRAYSLSSIPEDKHIQTCIKVVKNGRGSNWLKQRKPGDEIEFFGPNGKFLFKTPKNKKVLFIATGTGITPIISIIRDQLKKGNTQPFYLLFGLRYIKDIFYRDLFERLEKKHKNFTYDVTLSQPEKDNWDGLKGRVTFHLKNIDHDPGNTEAYLCGLKAMIISVTKILKQKDFKEKVIHFEKFD
ncbi:hypothetical protein GF366_02595 [Candidatus Peregrinibacteria bacterium]|nr:hypothetical protein [Candidatus Peregrinibacteria bacterium]